ncbi:hypothetical protein [Fervidibacillus albus]|uniref:Uncharacterized protein n=1 Tax=Fervidibacillus albus TaxID=2980026 RepID=A0A9E8LV55_9BACI|nr:hypothetical protein [Fervidibacillus albus]WAA10257.1 hypothetical protein OE104_02655 [Fervidibacillus albus]
MTNVEIVWAYGTVNGVSMYTIITETNSVQLVISLLSEIDGR